MSEEVNGAVTPGTTDAQGPTAPTPGTAPDNSGAASAGSATNTVTMTQAELDRIIAERLQRERDKSAKESAKAAQIAEAERLKGQQEWKTLAEKHEAELNALRPVAARAEAMEAVIKGMYTARLATLPQALRSAVDSLPVTDPLERLAWLDKNGALLGAAASAPNVNSGGAAPQGTQASLGGMTPQEFAAVYGLRADYVK